MNIHKEKNILKVSLTHYKDINSKWITDSNVKPETIKLKKKKEEILQDIVLGKGFLELTLKA